MNDAYGWISRRRHEKGRHPTAAKGLPISPSQSLRMKLRIQGPSIRLRLTQPEVAAFAEKGEIRLQTGFGLEYALCQTEATAPTVTFDAGTLTVWVPHSLAAHWVGSDQVGFGATQALPGGPSLELLVEKDFHCLHREGENKAELYPHPDASSD